MPGHSEKTVHIRRYIIDGASPWVSHPLRLVSISYRFPFHCHGRDRPDYSQKTPMSPGGIVVCCIISLAPAEHSGIRLMDEVLPASCCCRITANLGNEALRSINGTFNGDVLRDDLESI
jgi:hypothetical protein